MSLTISAAMLVGCGGTGSALAPHLAKLLKYHPTSQNCELTLVDGDIIEPRNLDRQNFTVDNVGKNKATALWSRIKMANVIAVDDYLSSSRLFKWLDRAPSCEGVPLIIAAVDNDATRKMILTKLKARGCDYIFMTPGNSFGDTRPRGQVFWCGQVNGEPIGIDLLDVYPNFAQPGGVIPTKGGCMEKAFSQPQLISSNLMAAAWTLAILQNILDLDIDPSLHAVYFGVRNLNAIAS